MNITQPPLIDVQGNINVHGRAGLSIPIKRYTDATQTTQIDISGDTLTFEVEGTPPIVIALIPDPGDVKGLLLYVPNLKTAGLLVTPDNPLDFVIRDASGASPVVRWRGQLLISGWEV